MALGIADIGLQGAGLYGDIQKRKADERRVEAGIGFDKIRGAEIAERTRGLQEQTRQSAETYDYGNELINIDDDKYYTQAINDLGADYVKNKIDPLLSRYMTQVGKERGVYQGGAGPQGVSSQPQRMIRRKDYNKSIAELDSNAEDLMAQKLRYNMGNMRRELSQDFTQMSPEEKKAAFGRGAYARRNVIESMDNLEKINPALKRRVTERVVSGYIDSFPEGTDPEKVGFLSTVGQMEKMSGRKLTSQTKGLLERMFDEQSLARRERNLVKDAMSIREEKAARGLAQEKLGTEQASYRTEALRTEDLTAMAPSERAAIGISGKPISTEKTAVELAKDRKALAGKKGKSLFATPVITDYTPESRKKFVKTKNPGDLVSKDKKDKSQAKTIGLMKYLIDTGVAKNHKMAFELAKQAATKPIAEFLIKARADLTSTPYITEGEVIQKMNGLEEYIKTVTDKYGTTGDASEDAPLIPTPEPSEAGRAEIIEKYPGARQADDGIWYMPDPKRPGKLVSVKVEP
jgi:hypothetical protein